MLPTRPVARLTAGERLNFLLTNRIPRRLATRFVGWLSRIENPLVAGVSIGLWRAFVDDLRLEEAAERRFPSMHACFTRALKPGARPIDPDPEVLVSPCDAVVGACGRIDGDTLIQAKGFPYTLQELVGDDGLAARYRDGLFVTLRLKSSMYHRFHAPAAGRIGEVSYIAGDTWNVNPVALKCVEKLYCRNERAVMELAVDGEPWSIALVPIAAILVASLKLHCLDDALDMDYGGPTRIPVAVRCARGEELGYFQHGSTVVLLAPGHLRPCPGVESGAVIRVGRPLLRKTAT